MLLYCAVGEPRALMRDASDVGARTFSSEIAKLTFLR